MTSNKSDSVDRWQYTWQMIDTLLDICQVSVMYRYYHISVICRLCLSSLMSLASVTFHVCRVPHQTSVVSQVCRLLHLPVTVICGVCLLSCLCHPHQISVACQVSVVCHPSLINHLSSQPYKNQLTACYWLTESFKRSSTPGSHSFNQPINYSFSITE